MPVRPDATSDLLFGLLALQTGVIREDALFEALRDWSGRRDRPIAEFLTERGAIDGASRSAVEALVAGFLDRRRVDQATTVDDSSAAGPACNKTTEVVDPAFQTTMGFGASPLPARAEVGDIASRVTQAGTIRDTPGRDPNATVAGTSTDGPAAGPDMTFSTGAAAASERFHAGALHASGGLGLVYVARDSELNREVALKRIKDRYADDPVSRSRFVLEAEVTGGLEHPGVVPVYGMGTYLDGRPYYAMRFIRGVSLDEELRRFHSDSRLGQDPSARSLELRKLLLRFLDVCNTIEYAHGRGVLHRDLKPPNIMVGDYGETLVVDWGIAKVLGRADLKRKSGERPLLPASGTGATETLAGTTIGTPAFMSPEQASGDIENLSPASDVYSLGATLYNLITGRAPFEGTDLKAVLLGVQKGTFPAPREVDRSIDRALEAICLKAMALKPGDRYPSARALAEDVERWMADEPVSARPDPPSERLRRWMRRRRTAVTAGAAAVLVATLGLTVVLAVEARANRELRDANQEVQARFALAQKAIRTFHTGVTEDLLLGQKEFAEQRDKLLRSALEFYGELERVLRGRSDRPSREALARAYFEVGELTSRIGSKPEALDAHRKSLVLREALAREEGAGPDAVADVGRSRIAIGVLERETGKFPQAEAEMAAGRALLEGMVRDGKATPEVLSDLAAGYHQVGSLLADTDRSNEALESHRRARDIRTGLFERYPTVARYRADLARSHEAIGLVLDKIGRPADALAACVAARDIREALHARDPSSKEYQADLASSASLLGILFGKTSRVEDALRAHARARQLREALVRVSPSVTRFQSDLAGTHSRTAQLLSRVGRRPEALAAYERARDIWQTLATSNPSVPNFRSNLVAVLGDLGWELVRAGRIDEALRTFETSRGVQEDLVRAQPTVSLYQSNLALIHVRIGRVQADSGRPAEAVASYAKARDIQEGLVNASPNVPRYASYLAWSHDAIGTMLEATGRLPEAMESYLRARSIREHLARDDPGNPSYLGDLAQTTTNVGRLSGAMGRTDVALASFRQALEALEPLVRANPTVLRIRVDLANSLEALGDLLESTGPITDARRTHERARAIRRELADGNPAVTSYRVDLARSDDALAGLIARLGRPDEALALHVSVRDARESIARSDPELPEHRADLAISDENIAARLVTLGRASEAATALGRAREAWEALAADCPSVVANQRGLVRTLRGEGELLALLNQTAEATESLSRSGTAARSLAAAYPAVPDFPLEASLADESRAILDWQRGRTGEAASRLAQAATTLAGLPRPRPGDLVVLARLHARRATLASSPGSGLSAADARIDSDRAIRDLLRAAAVGFHDLDRLAAEPGLERLRERPEYAVVRMDVAFPAEPFSG